MTKDLGKTSTGLEANVAGLICYLGGWVIGLIFFLIEKENKFVRFHAMQSIITFGALTVLEIAFSVMPILDRLTPIIHLAFVGLWVLCMVKAYQGENFRLPIAGDAAEKNT